jgi:hypothetical protein
MTRRLEYLRRCPYCRQVLPEFRLGTRMSELKARIFDAVLRTGKEGIGSEDLFAIAYAGHAKGQPRTLKAHIQQINEAIEDSGYRIVSRGAGGGYCGSYYLVRF